MLFSAEKTKSLSCLPDSPARLPTDLQAGKMAGGRQAGLPDPGAPRQAGRSRVDVFAHTPRRVCQTALGTSRPVRWFCGFWFYIGLPDSPARVPTDLQAGKMAGGRQAGRRAWTG